MNKRLTKPHEKNERLEKPCGRLGVPPDPTACVTVLSGGTVVIVSGDCRVIRRDRSTSLPQ